MNAKDLVTPVLVNGIHLYVGDTVYLRGVGIPNVLLAAFLGRLASGELRFLIHHSMATTLGLTGVFRPKDLSEIKPDKGVDDAIPIESGDGDYFPWFPVVVKDTRQEGVVIAALSGVIAVLIQDEIFTFGTHQLEQKSLHDLFAP